MGLAAIAITDHDTVAGHAEALAAGPELGVEIVPGVEVSSEYGTYTAHLLGYYPEPDAPALAALLAELRAHRDERNPRILARLAELRCPLSPEDVAAEARGQVIGRPHIAAAMVRKGYVRSADDAFERYLGRGARAYVERRKVAPAQAIGALLRSRAVPVLAHPGDLGVKSADAAETVVRALVELGLRGIEVYYHAHNAAQSAAYLGIARRYGLIVTGGSDFHGASKPGIQLGRGGGRMFVPYELLARLREERARL